LNENTVTHPGFIKVVESHRVEVSIISVAGCASCQIKGSCSISDTKVKSVWIEMADTTGYQAGQKVTIEMRQSMGTWAVLLGYVFPFVVLLAGLIVFIEAGLDQGLAGLMALGMLVPYYGLLYLMRNSLSKRFQYTLHK